VIATRHGRESCRPSHTSKQDTRKGGVIFMGNLSTQNSITNEAEKKICSKCKRLLPTNFNYFYHGKTSKDGYRNICRECMGRKFIDLEMVGKKVCSGCKKILPATPKYFYRARAKKKTGLCYKCKICMGAKEYKEPIDYLTTKHKTCSLCKDKFPATSEYFYRRKNRKQGNGLQTYCKKCAKIIYNNYYDSNKLKKREQMANYRKNNKELVSSWPSKDKKTVCAYMLKRRNKKRGLQCNFKIGDWEKCKIDFNNRCSYCGIEVELTQEHFIPLNSGGEYTINNIIPACKSCNSSKQDNDFFEWYPQQPFYSKQRERKILKYLNYDPKTKYQQIAL
jgi:5-methylcytosine-specific restriction endonuclease McrA/RNase P subunit RPR2